MQIVKYLDSPFIICDYELRTKDMLTLELDKRKYSMENDVITYFIIDEIDKWVVEFVSINDKKPVLTV